MQPHPEFESPAIHGLIQDKSGAVAVDRVEHAKRQLSAANNNAEIGKKIADFFMKERA